MTNRSDILKRLHELKEYKTVKHVHELNEINKIHSYNFATLRNHLEKLPDLQSSMPGNFFNTSIHSKIERNDYGQRLSQYLNNYLSSAFSVVDYSRKHYEKYYTGEKILEYLVNQLARNCIPCSIHFNFQAITNIKPHNKT